MKDIREAVCTVWKDLNGNNKLAAFYTCAAAVEPQTIKRRCLWNSTDIWIGTD